MEKLTLMVALLLSVALSPELGTLAPPRKPPEKVPGIGTIFGSFVISIINWSVH